ncbi:hypothetical protein CDAR_118801 [Caerostris darwini]|uniref:Uncharacterized protein n=1 Tax=Caerostris darwini TaxID=1538125 RepID=A0AAV4TQW7_9ARAC|nr:hypothetical protein CDAR_118801 [Caerostris darwini]
MEETRKISQVQISSVTSHGFPNDSAAPFKGVLFFLRHPLFAHPFWRGTEERVDPSRKMKGCSLLFFFLGSGFLAPPPPLMSAPESRLA